MSGRKEDKPITYLKNRTAELMREVNEKCRTVTITQNGEAKAVVMDVETYEVRSNLVMSLAQCEGPEDLVGVPGWISSVFGQPRAVARPALGDSHYTARIILAVRREMANLRAALEIKYRADLVAVIERMGLAARSLEPVLSGAADVARKAIAIAEAYTTAKPGQETEVG